jgi:hypothetical protein
MAGPVAAFVTLPDDSGNTGKKVRTQSRTVSGQTVHEHFFVKGYEREILGNFRLSFPQQTAQAAAQNGTSSGFAWLHVPSAISNKWARIRRIVTSSQHSSALATPTAPRVVFARMTFTGTASGASLSPVKLRSDYPSAVLDIRTAVTGLTVSLVGNLGHAAFCQAVTAVGAQASPTTDVLWVDEEDDFWVFKPGEGLVIYQDVAGTTSDTRKMNLDIAWDEIDVA